MVEIKIVMDVAVCQEIDKKGFINNIYLKGFSMENLQYFNLFIIATVNVLYAHSAKLHLSHGQMPKQSVRSIQGL